MWAKHKQKSGFTIVELLIVIVVIAILAAISIVAYNGIQARAENSKTINGVGAYIKAFNLYVADNGVYPSSTGYPCLGVSASGGCAKLSVGDPTCNYSGNTNVIPAFDALLVPYMGPTKPSISEQVINCAGGDTYRGAYMEANSGNVKTMRIVYHLKGDLQCSAIAGVTVAQRQQSGDVTRCILQMPTL